jgi:MauM/NapG family ferredoxin protein
VTEPAYQFLRDKIFIRKRQSFVGAAGIFAFFIAIVLLNVYRRRFWCRYICPLGALLGTCSKRPSLRLVHNDKCTKCGLCGMKCPAGADPDKPGEWRPTECYSCWNCVAACNREAVTFKFKSPIAKPTEAKLDLSKRAVLSAGVAGVGGLMLLRLSPEAQARTFNPALIRPPGARPEREFLARCVKCGICMRVCPTNGLNPTGLEAGLEGIWTPQLLPKLGPCEYECNACGYVCPTQAIKPLTLPEKQATKIGLATFDTSRCLPYAYGRQCMVCEEHCPLPKKAIYFFDTEIKLRDGGTIKIKQPHVDPDLCIGCGLCENSCVFKDLPAIRVTSANETRHPKHQAIMPGLPPMSGSDPYAK